MTLIFLIVCGFFAGFIDSIAGGGGLISLPSLLAAGVPPHIALGTNKVQSAIGTVFSTTRYIKSGHVYLPVAITSFVGAFSGSFAGSEVVLHMPATTLMAVIPALIIIVGFVTFIKKKFGDKDTFSLMSFRYYVFSFVFGFLLGFYDGFFGPGTGSFLAFGFVLFFKFGFLRATGNAKLTNLASNLSAIIAFVLNGKIFWLIALPMGCANILGAWIGAGLAIRGGAKFIRPVFGVVLFGLLLKIIFF